METLELLDATAAPGGASNPRDPVGELFMEREGAGQNEATPLATLEGKIFITYLSAKDGTGETRYAGGLGCDNASALKTSFRELFSTL